MIFDNNGAELSFCTLNEPGAAPKPPGKSWVNLERESADHMAM